MRLRLILSIAVGLILSSMSFSDSWQPAKCFVRYSNNGMFSTLITPAEPNIPGTIDVFKELTTDRKEPEVSFEDDPNMTREQYGALWKDAHDKWKAESCRELLWNTTISNYCAPLEVHVCDNGKYVVTLDNYFGVGMGKDVIAFYNKKGQVKQYSLKEAIIDILPEDYDKVNKWLDGDDYVEPDELFWASDLPFSKSMSSVWWRQSGITFLYEMNGRTLLCIWFDWADQWLCWDVASGEKIVINDSLLSQLDNKGSELFRKRIDTFRMDPFFVEAPLRYFLRFKHKEDEERVRAIFQRTKLNVTVWNPIERPEGVSSDSSEKKIADLDYFYSQSHFRDLAEKTLSIWNGKMKDPGSDDIQNTVIKRYNYLGVVNGTVVFPEKPKEQDKGWIYLVPIGFTQESWFSAELNNVLEMRFDGGLWSHYDMNYTKNVKFQLRGVTPGEYWVKCVWDRAEPYIEEEQNENIGPSKGDWESVGKEIIKVEAGKVVEGIVIDEFVEVKD